MLFAIPDSWRKLKLVQNVEQLCPINCRIDRHWPCRGRSRIRIDHRCHVIVRMICHHPLVPNRSVKNLVQLKKFMKKKITVFSPNSVRESKSNLPLQCTFLVFVEYAGNHASKCSSEAQRAESPIVSLLHYFWISYL